MVQIILEWAIPTMLACIFTYIIKELKGNCKNNIAIKNSMIILLRSQITSKVETYIALGYLPDYGRDCLEKLFYQYKSLGGNDGVSELVKQCFKLPPVKIERSD